MGICGRLISLLRGRPRYMNIGDGCEVEREGLGMDTVR